MGQYYTPVIKRNDKFNTYLSHNYDNGLKLMEHSYLGNNFVDTVLKQLYNKPGQLAWVGDYAEPCDVANFEAVYFIKAQERGGYKKPVDAGGSFTIDKIVVNHSKNEYVDLLEYDKLTHGLQYQINPIPLLTAIGNGKGGGDYHGTNMDKIGNWACDLIEVKNYIPTGYKNITEEIIFEE